MRDLILITGGQGFLGRAVARDWLLNTNATVVSIGRSKRNDTHYSHHATWNGVRVQAPLGKTFNGVFDSLRYRYVSQDINDQTGLCRLIQQLRPSHIIHLAGVLRDSAISDLCDGNISGTSSLLQAVVGSHWTPKSIVLGSSGGVYGIPTTIPISEEAVCQPIDPYSASKLAAEHFARILGSQHNLPLRWARIFNCIGAGQDERHLTSWLALQLAEIEWSVREPVISVGDLSTTRDYIHATDVACALRCIAKAGTSQQVYNVATGVETSGEELLNTGLDIIGRSSIQRDSKKIRPSDIPRHVGDISRLKKLGFTPITSIRDSVEEMIKWYQKEVQSDRTLQQGQQHRTHFTVSVAHRHSYDVNIEAGLTTKLPEVLSQSCSQSKLHLITDENVWDLYGRNLFEAIEDAALSIHRSVLPAGERTKDSNHHARLIRELNEGGFQRRSIILALGGGVVLDLAGFVAATYMRGVEYINVPTTLLAQHDAAIGGKTAVNMPWSKNFVGAFHHPRAVFIDPVLLKTLDDKDISSGVAEAIKVAMCGSHELFTLLEENVTEIRYNRSVLHLQQLVALAAQKKSEILSTDPYEVDLRRVLNLGHTIGHPVETLLMYKGLRHGEAVGFGIAASTAIAEHRGLISTRNSERILQLLNAYGLPPKLESTVVHKIHAHLDSVLRIRGGNLNFVLPQEIDRVVVVQDVSFEEIDLALQSVCQRFSPSFVH